MSLDSLLRLVSTSATHSPNKGDESDMAFAEVASSGNVTSINPFGRLAWGWRVGSTIATDLRFALQAVESDEPVELPVTQGGLHLQGMARSDGKGWFLIGYDPVGEDGDREHFSFRALMDRLPQPAFCLNAKGLAWYVNEAVGRLLGEPAGHLQGRPVLSELIDPEDRWKLAELLELAARDGSAHASVRYGVDRTIGVLHVVAAVRDEFQAIILAMPDEDEFLNGSHIQESFYQSFLEQGPIGVIYLDAQARVTFENHYFRSIVGPQAEASWLGLFVREIASLPKDVADDLIALCRDGTPLSRKAGLVDPESAETTHFLNLHASPIRHPDGRILGAAVLIEDRSDVERQERQLAARTRITQAEAALRQVATSHPEPDAFRLAAAESLGKYACADRVILMGLSVAQDCLVEVASWSKRNDGEPMRSVSMTDPQTVQTAVEKHFDLTCVHSYAYRDNQQFAGYLVLGWDHPPRPGECLLGDQLDSLASVFESLYSWLMLGARFKSTVGAIDDALFSFSLQPDRKRRYHFLTDQIEVLTGRSARVLSPEGPTEVEWNSVVVHPEDRPLVRAHDQVLTRGDESRITYRVLHTDGTIRWLREHATPRTDATGMTAVEGILSDVTEQKAAELVLLQAKREAEESNRSKTAFIATMSHEIRTPLGAVNGFAQLLEREIEEVEEEMGQDLPEQIHEFTRAISERSRKLLALVHDLFELSNIEMGHSVLQSRPVAFRSAVERSANKCRPEMEGKGIDFVVDLPEEEVVVRADARRLDQVLDNLFSNAIKFTDAGTVSVQLVENDTHALLEVHDTGIGISEDYLEHLFDAFTQEEDWRSRRFEGTGLGLALVRRQLELMGGSIEVESEKHVGSRFRVTIPLEASRPEEEDDSGDGPRERQDRAGVRSPDHRLDARSPARTGRSA